MNGRGQSTPLVAISPRYIGVERSWLWRFNRSIEEYEQMAKEFQAMKPLKVKRMIRLVVDESSKEEVA